MRISPIFEPTDAQVDVLVKAYPLGMLISPETDGMLATPLPLLLERHSGRLTLLGHFARSNPHIEVVRAQSKAFITFSGPPQGYISPSWFADRSQAPTWNFATVHFDVDVRLMDRVQAASEAVTTLTQAMEQDRPRAWNVHELGVRRAQLIQHVVAFRATVLRTRAKFKLGQNERKDVLMQAIEGLQRDGHIELAAMMQSANAGRLAS
jgi:predicted FMN-binding regulatory protein PaiB